MTLVDLLSDTVYREQACKHLNDMFANHEQFPVAKSQIYGLRQIVRQEPGKAKDFASHQQERTERKLQHRKGPEPRLKAEISFWRMVCDMCDSRSGWSVRKEGSEHAPAELRDGNIPTREECTTNAERSHRAKLRRRQREWLEQWNREHLRAFFERFCTHALYLRETLRAKSQRN